MNYELLNKLIDERKVSKSALAEKLGLSRQGLYNKLNGDNDFLGSEMKNISEALSLSNDERDAIFFDSDVG